MHSTMPASIGLPACQGTGSGPDRSGLRSAPCRCALGRKRGEEHADDSGKEKTHGWSPAGRYGGAYSFGAGPVDPRMTRSTGHSSWIVSAGRPARSSIGELGDARPGCPDRRTRRRHGRHHAVGVEEREDVVMGDHRHVAAELEPGGAHGAKGTERHHHRGDEERRRPRLLGEEALGEADSRPRRSSRRSPMKRGSGTRPRPASASRKPRSRCSA